MTFTEHYQAAKKRIDSLGLRYPPSKPKPVMALAMMALLLALWTSLRREEPPAGKP